MGVVKSSEGRMKLKKLKSILDGVETFDKPNVELEQYPTPPDIAGEKRIEL